MIRLKLVIGIIGLAGAWTAVQAQTCDPVWDSSIGRPGLTEGENYTGAGEMAVFDDGSGPALYVVGHFTKAGGQPANNIARWNGHAWSPVGPGFDSRASGIAVYDDGTGPALYACGNFEFTHEEQPLALNHIAKWDGAAWSPVGQGLNFACTELFVFDDGVRTVLVAGGYFSGTADGAVAMNHIGQWYGQQWSPLGDGVSDNVWSMATFDDGTGPALYVGGYFTDAGGLTVNCIARWDGTDWTSLGTGVGRDGQLGVQDLAVFDDGSGCALFAGGRFDVMDGLEVNYIAKWDGQEWRAVGSGMNNWIRGLDVFDDGTGSQLYAAGNFLTAGSVNATGIARWDGESWTTVGDGDSIDQGFLMATFDHGTGPSLYISSPFRVGDQAVGRMVEWRGCLELPGNFDGDGYLDLSDFKRFVACVSGPDGTVISGCERADADGNGTIDVYDFARFQRSFSSKPCP